MSPKMRPSFIAATGIVFSLSLGATARAVPADDGPPWHGDGLTDGVQVEHRDVPGSSFRELRLSLVTTVPVSQICEAVYPKVYPTTVEQRFKKRVLIRETATDRWTYEQISVPLVSDRDYVVHTKLEAPASTGQCSVSFVNAEDPAYPPTDGFVRIPVIRGRWDIFPIGDGKVSVQYRIFSEPGGGVPAFVSRGGQKSAAVDFMKIVLARAGGGSPQ
jgi:hypothetical protein